MADVSAQAAEERRDLATFLDTLDPDEWERPSLCAGWSVRDVVGHIASYDVLGWGGSLALLARSGFSLGRCNQAGIDRSRRMSTDDLVAQLRDHATPRGLTSMFGSHVALVDGLIHHQDVRRALGRPREVPAERLRAVLGFLPRARALPAPGHLREVRAVATDLNWAHGSGPELKGPGEAVVMALAGRAEALTDLTGPGVDTLAARLR